MKLDLSRAPLTRELVAKHEYETAALPMNPDTFLLAVHAQKQVLELLGHAIALELDAERYRWLKANARHIDIVTATQMFNIHGSNLDKVLDVARDRLPQRGSE